MLEQLAGLTAVLIGIGAPTWLAVHQHRQVRPHQVDNPGDNACDDDLVTHAQVLPWLPASVRADFPAARTDEPAGPAVCRVNHQDGVTRPRAHVHPPVMDRVPWPPGSRPRPPASSALVPKGQRIPGWARSYFDPRCDGEHDWIDIRSMRGFHLRVCCRCDATDDDPFDGLPLAREWW